MLPNFLVIGAAKAGTTSLYHYLSQHPDVFMSAIKEVNFFAWEGEDSPRYPVRNLADYEALFAEAGGARARGEASPSYLASETAAARIQQALPDVRLVASLRDPVERAYSGYLMHLRHGSESRPPEQAFGPEDGYVQGGFYHERLRRYYERFPRERIHVCLFEELGREPLEVCRALFGFLGVDPDFRPDVSQRHNVGGVPRNARLYQWLGNSALSQRVRGWVPAGLKRWVRRGALDAPPPCPPEVRERLRALYREDVERSQELIGRDLSAWLAPEPAPTAPLSP